MYFKKSSTLLMRNEIAQFYAISLSYALAAHKVILDSIPENDCVNNGLLLKESLETFLETHQAINFLGKTDFDKELIQQYLKENLLYRYLQEDKALSKETYIRGLLGLQKEVGNGLKDVPFDFPEEEIKTFFSQPELYLPYLSKNLVKELYSLTIDFHRNLDGIPVDCFEAAFYHDLNISDYEALATILDSVFIGFTDCVLENFNKDRYLLYPEYKQQHLAQILVGGISGQYIDDVTAYFEAYILSDKRRTKFNTQAFNFIYIRHNG